jgi:osmotically-inducible protein OsmY
MRRFLLLAALPFLLNACASLVISAGTEAAISAAENRSAGRKVDDKLLYADIIKQFTTADKGALVGDVNINTRFARVMLTGTVDNEQAAADAVALAWKAKGVEEVINELVVDPSANIISTAGDSLVKRNIEARLLITKDVWVINYSIDVQNGVAYIIGRVKDQGELDRVMSICRTTKGVKRVVSHLQVNPETNLAPAGTPSTPSPRPMGSSTSDTSGTLTPLDQIEVSPNSPASGGY